MLWSFTSFLHLISVVIAILAVYSAFHSGLCAANSNQHYLWTYAPTALFTLLAAIWTRINYRVKQTFPWQMMATKPVPASQSVLLDYITATKPQVVVLAFRKRHNLIGISSFTSLCFKVTIVLSTGLISMKSTSVRQPSASVGLQDRFRLQDPGFDPKYTDFRSSMNMIAIHQYNLTPPVGTTSSYAYQRFQTPEERGADAHSVEAYVEVFGTDVSCEKASANLSSDDSVRTLSSASCSEWYVYPFSIGFVDNFQVSAQMVNCTRDGNVTSEARIALLAGHGTTTRSRFELTPNATSPNITALVCEPSYSIRRHSVSARRGNMISLGQAADEADRVIDGISALDLWKAFITRSAVSRLLLLLPPTSPTGIRIICCLG